MWLQEFVFFFILYNRNVSWIYINKTVSMTLTTSIMIIFQMIRMTGEAKFLEGIWNTRQLIVFTIGFEVFLPWKLVDNSAVVFLSSMCISLVAPLDVEDPVIVGTSAETAVCKKSGQCDFNFNINMFVRKCRVKWNPGWVLRLPPI